MYEVIVIPINLTNYGISLVSWVPFHQKLFSKKAILHEPDGTANN